ncbi:MAG: Rrf2 family transcriptional regulator, partial [Phycisphaeraceae bacterium]|nr:Rrf2 family transcriptional regulator [Phycisphaeraceae bacterium]
MAISKRCEYALRAIFELGIRNTGMPVKIQAIAQA